jgi:hypothetical protein
MPKPVLANGLTLGRVGTRLSTKGGRENPLRQHQSGIVRTEGGRIEKRPGEVVGGSAVVNSCMWVMTVDLTGQSIATSHTSPSSNLAARTSAGEPAPFAGI